MRGSRRAWRCSTTCSPRATRGTSRIAKNLAATYASRLYERVERLLDEDRTVPEPELEHFFKLVLAFDQIGGALPPSARALKIEVARRLIDRYYEGHPAERKLEALRALERLEED